MSTFHQTRARLTDLVQQSLDFARSLGATAAEAEASESAGLSVNVRLGEVETLEYTRDKGVGITVYVGQQRGHASTSDFSVAALQDTVSKAHSIASKTGADPAAGLSDAELFERAPRDLKLFHPWDISVEEAIALAQRCEASAMEVDERINNSDGASISTHDSHFIYGNSLGFVDGYASSRHSLYCAVIAESEQGMQRDSWYDTHRVGSQLAAPEVIGRQAGERTVRRLDARRLPTAQVPVLFEAPIAASLIGHFVNAVSGSSLYRRSSFLVDSLGEQIFAPTVELLEDPFLEYGLASCPFDNEGVRVEQRRVVEGGRVNGYFLSTYSARKLGMVSTGNAGGNHNLILGSTGEDFATLLQKMGTGLLVTDVMGQGVNLVTGDYSRGASGFWVENGVITFPVEEITIAGNLRDMFRNIVAIGSDIQRLGSKHCGSILIDGMTVAGE